MANPLLQALKGSRSSRYALPDNYQDTPDGQSMLSTIGNTALSGVSAVGNFLDIGGGIVRNTLAGENPLAPLFHPFSDEGRVTGRDLLRKHGLVGSQDTYANWLGGFAAELVLDPSTYVGLGPLTKAGKAAQAAGTLGKGTLKGIARRMGGNLGDIAKPLADAAFSGLAHSEDAAKSLAALHKSAAAAGIADVFNSKEPLQALFSVGLPFTEGTTLGTGALSQRVASVLDMASNAAKVSGPGRAVRMLFDPAVGGKYSHAEQLVEEAKFLDADKAIQRARLGHTEVLDKMKEVWGHAEQYFTDTVGLSPNTYTPDELTKQAQNLMQKTVRFATEVGHDPAEALKYLAPNAPAPPSHIADQISSLTRMAQKQRDRIAEVVRLKGGKMGLLGDIEVGLGASAGTPPPSQLEWFGLGPKDVENPHFPRYKEFGKALDKNRNLSARTGSMLHRADEIRYVPSEVVNDILKDPAARDAAYIQNKWGKFLAKNADNYKTPLEHAEALAKWADEHNATSIFNFESQDDHFKYLLGMSTVDKNLDAMHGLVAQNMKDAGAAPYSLDKVFKRAGMDTDKALAHLSSLTGKTPDQLKGMFLDEDVAKAIEGTHAAVSNPIWSGKIADWFDATNKWFKQNVTLPFPGFAARNHIGGQYLNIAASGEIQNAADLAAYGKHYHGMFSAARNGIDPELMNELYANKVFNPQTVTEGVDTGAWGMELAGPQNPFNVKQTWQQSGDALKDSMVAGMLGKVPGGKKASTAWQTVLGTGAKANQWVEWQNRVPMYMYLTREKGWDPLAAAAKVNQLQIDYGSLAPFEKDVMKRLVPFWTFQRKIAPVLFETILKKPGGAVAQTIRAENRAHGENALTPDYVASTLAIPNPFKTPTEGQSYITGFGLPFEQTLQFAENFPSPRAAGREALAMMTPIVKAPLEWASGQSFFQSGPGGGGRPLEELDPTLGRTISNIAGAKQPMSPGRGAEFLLSNSPASKVLTTARQLSDPRKTYGEKALNLLTGVRVTDVSPAAEDAVLRERARNVMKGMGAKTFERVYFPKADMEAMPANERKEAERFNALMTLLATNAKERKLGAKQLVGGK